tara:strand:- start:41 stop:514 length:474 start_codon:yes stop_codon:yes gene_type:complete
MSFQILRGILAMPDINAQQKLVLVVMNQYGKDGADIYPSIDTIAKLASLSPRQTKRHIKTLRLKGYLKPQGKSRNNTIKYALNVPTRVPSRAGPEGRQRPTNNLYNNLDSTLTRDSYINSRNQQALNIDRFSNVKLPESGSEIAIRLQREREARRKR